MLIVELRSRVGAGLAPALAAHMGLAPALAKALFGGTSLYAEDHV